MARVIWGARGERFYETGTDRGVLYLGTNPGVAWNGLISVKENPSGGGAKPFYIDGFKYLNVAESEEFEASIEAFSSPAEFGICDGTISVRNGLFVTQQTRKPFGLCYRTKLGNDTEGVDHGYKLHLVYNALAAPSSRSNTTLNESIDPTTLNWSISTMPPLLSGYKASAHLVIDSRLTDPAILVQVEEILYGTSVSQASFPTPSEFISIFSG
jgi:hypothetical protein